MTTKTARDAISIAFRPKRSAQAPTAMPAIDAIAPVSVRTVPTTSDRCSAVTANVFVRQELFHALGGFDEELPSGGDADFAHRVVAGRGRLIYCPDAVVLHPTMDRARQFLHKVWRTSRWTATRRARSHKRPSLAGYFSFVPFIGVAHSRRMALRPALGLELRRLRACGARPRLRDRIYAMMMIYFVVSHVAGFARLLGWVTEKVNQQPTKLNHAEWPRRHPVPLRSRLPLPFV